MHFKLSFNKTIALSLLVFIFAQLPKGVFAVIENYRMNKKVVISQKDTVSMQFVDDGQIYQSGWDKLAQVQFWQDVIKLSGDSCIINISSCRTPLHRVSRNDWTALQENEKTFLKDSLGCINNFDESNTKFVTTGKAEFYEIRKVLSDINESISVFKSNGADPWYAQAIILIESPGKRNQKSSAGANGPFQLMKSVARKYGLHVSSTRDDRTNLKLSAVAASKLINQVCVPNTKSLLNDLGVSYRETDLWFRLLVLHAYHSGSGNLSCALRKMQPAAGGVPLFTSLWKTECGSFKNQSQNYSQIALASLIAFDKLLATSENDTLYMISGDVEIRKYKKPGLHPAERFEYLMSAARKFESDLIDGVITLDYFNKQLSYITKEIKNHAGNFPVMLSYLDDFVYPGNEDQLLFVARRLNNKQRYTESIQFLNYCLLINPNNIFALDMLSKAYSVTGKKELSTVYAGRSSSLKQAAESLNKD